MNAPGHKPKSSVKLFKSLFCIRLALTSRAIAQTFRSRLRNPDTDSQSTVIDVVRLINHINGANVSYGDVNEDCAVNLVDVNIVADAILGLRALTNLYVHRRSTRRSSPPTHFLTFH